MLDGCGSTPRLAALLADRSLRGVIDHFVNVLDLPRSELLAAPPTSTSAGAAPARPQLAGGDLHRQRRRVLQQARARRSGAPATPARCRRTSGTSRRWGWSRWPTSCAASTTTSRCSPRSARKPSAIRRHDLDGAAVRGSAVDMQYTLESLREIFINNIRREKERNLVDPEAGAQPIRSKAFLGTPRCRQRLHHEDEDVRLHLPPHPAPAARPHDHRPEALRPAPGGARVRTLQGGGESRRHRDRAEYLNEIAPTSATSSCEGTGAPALNVLRAHEVEDIFLEHNARRAASETRLEHIFCMLFRAACSGTSTSTTCPASACSASCAPASASSSPTASCPTRRRALRRPSGAHRA